MAPLIQLTSTGAVVPYGICLDGEKCIWVAAKGGVFRFSKNGQCLFSDKYEHPKQTVAFSTVRYIGMDGGVLVKYADENGCCLTLYDLQGVRKATSILDSPTKSIAVSESGDIFLTSSQQNSGKSEILRGNVTDLIEWEPITTCTDFQFDQICCVPGKELLIVSRACVPTNPYSDQDICIIDFNGQISATFSQGGKSDGQIYWPRAIQVNQHGNVVILDKTGRLQEFHGADGSFLRLIDTVPAGLGNGFCIDEARNQILVTCSGLVFSEGDHGHAECNDWIESLNID